MIQDRLNDATIALNQTLSAAGVKFGIFGGYAIFVHGGPRESKDIDCLAAVTKARTLHYLNNKNRFAAIPQTREDYVAFLWFDKADCDQYPGAQVSMSGLATDQVTVTGQRLGRGTSRFWDPFLIFKGKLRAAALRSKFHDSADLRMLAGIYRDRIRASAHLLNPLFVGLAIKRYLVLERLFLDLGVDIAPAKEAARTVELGQMPPLAVGGVQEGILG